MDSKNRKNRAGYWDYENPNIADIWAKASNACKWEDCNKPQVINGKNGEVTPFCSGHLAQYYRVGLEGMKPLRDKNKVHNHVCDFEDCGRSYYAQGYCKTHYEQYKRGSELKPINSKAARDAEATYQANLAKLQETFGGCLEWLGDYDENHYGSVWDGHTMPAHRYFWAKKYGTPPKNREVDHICNNRACCNTDHLQLLPGRLNVARSRGHEVFATTHPNVFKYDGDLIYYNDTYHTHGYIDDPAAYGLTS